MITEMINGYEHELSDFLYRYNNLKEYFVAWIPENFKEISAFDKSGFLLCIEKDKIVGCLGRTISDEQKVVRLLGPIIIQDYFDKYIDELFKQCLQSLPDDMKEIKIAFFEENTLCRNWCERNGFALYNSEKTMVYQGNSPIEFEMPMSVTLKPYEPKYRNGLATVHPQETFFTLNELIDGISEYRHLLLAIVQDEVTGYICYEQTKDKKQGEILLLHVRNDQRNKSYGTLLLNRAIRSLTNANVEQIFISVRTDNYGAEALYKRMGFVDKETVYAYRKQVQ